ncbi:VCBS repeat-containing protein, partial [archaeon]|nr:VCBS repeat-containing protein [archaeon]
VQNGDAETGTTYNWVSWSGVNNTDYRSGSYSFERIGYAQVQSSELIPIDINKKYNLTGWFRSNGTAGNSILYFGFIPYDKDGLQIGSQHVNLYTNSETTLYEDCNAASNSCKIVNGSNWATYAYGVMAFNVDSTGNYRDLPNRNITNYGLTVTNKGSYWEVNFTGGAPTSGVSAPKGTTVREHMYGSSYMYDGAVYSTVPNSTWTNYSGIVQGESLYGIGYGKWWRGTKYAQILMLNNYAQSTSYKLFVDDITLKSEPQTYTGPIWNSSGASGGAYSFDGKDDYVNLSLPSSLNQDFTKITISAWVYIRNVVGEPIIVGKLGLKYAMTYYTDGKAYFYIRQGGNNAKAAVGLNSWHHLVGVFNGTNISIYVDGSLVETVASAFSSTGTDSNPVLIGAQPPYYFNGSIDEVRIYNRSLTADQIRLLYLNQTDKIHFNETSAGEKWSACVTPNDALEDGTTACSANLTIRNTVPSISGPVASPTTIGYGYNVSVNVTATQTDADAMDVWLNITYPNSTTAAYQMTSIGGNIYQYNVTGAYGSNQTWLKGMHNLTCWANNSGGTSSTAQFNFTVDANTTSEMGTDKTVYKASTNVYLSGTDVLLSNWTYRMPITVNATKYNLTDYLITIPINFTKLLTSVGASGTMTMNHFRVYEYNNVTGAMMHEVRSRFVNNTYGYSPTANAAGKIDFLLNGTTTAGTTRYFYIFFDINENGTKTAPYALENSRTYFYPQTDVDRDGHRELVVARSDGYIYVYKWNASGGNYYLNWTSPATGGTPGLALGDINNDTKPEIVVAVPGGNIYAYTFNSTSGSYDGGMIITGQYTTYQIALGDIDKDGVNEILVGGHTYDASQAWGWNGTNYVLEKTLDITDAAGAPQQVDDELHAAAGDIDNDGSVEMLTHKWAGSSPYTMNVWGHNGADYVHEFWESNYFVGMGFQAFDSDDDGIDEVAMVGIPSGYQGAYGSFNGTAFNWVYSSNSFSHYYASQDFADWDADGQTEVALASLYGELFTYHYNSTSNAYTLEWTGTDYGTYTLTPRFGDVDEDGIIELFVPHENVIRIFNYA